MHLQLASCIELSLDFRLAAMAAADIAHQRQADAEALELGLAMHALKDAKQLA